jgi:hypothetical protein
MISPVSQAVIAKVFPAGIPVDQLDLVQRIAVAVDEVFRTQAPAQQAEAQVVDLRPTKGTRTAALNKALEREQAFFSALQKGATVADLQAITGHTSGAVRMRLKRMKDEGYVFASDAEPAPGRGSAKVGRPGNFYRLLSSPSDKRSSGQ